MSNRCSAVADAVRPAHQGGDYVFKPHERPFLAGSPATPDHPARRKLGYLLDSDIVVAHKDEVLFVAINEAKSMAASGWRAPL